jgi:hypothetical protein
MPKYYRVSQLCVFTVLLSVCLPVTLSEWIQMFSWWVLCRSKDMIYIAVVWYNFWYACIEEWMRKMKMFLSYRNLRTDQQLSTTPEVIWQPTLSYRINVSKLENYVFLLHQGVHSCAHPPMETHNRFGSAKLHSAISSRLTLFHICKKHKFLFGSHFISADENLLLNHTRPHTLWRYFGKIWKLS